MARGGMAAPARAGETLSRASGRQRVIVRANYVALPSMAGRGQDEGGRKPAGSEAETPVLSRKYDPAAKNRRDGAPKGDARCGLVHTTGLPLRVTPSVAPFGVPSPHVCEGHR